MRYTIKFEEQFTLDVKNKSRKYPDLHDELQDIISEIIEKGTIPKEYNPHILKKSNLNYAGHMEFHLFNDLLIIYVYISKRGTFRFERLGTHEELFHGKLK